MANTFTYINSVSVGVSGASAIEFTSIPSSYTDLIVLLSTKPSASDTMVITLNSSTTTYTNRYLESTGSTVATSTNAQSGRYVNYIFSGEVNNIEIYIPEYTSSNNKIFYIESTSGRNVTENYQDVVASLWSTTDAISSVKVNFLTANFSQYSTATLYGIKSS